MKSYGHIKISRKAFDDDPDIGDPWWLEPRTFSRWEAWVHLIQLAQWRPCTHHTKYGPVRLERGEFVASRSMLARTFGWGERQVRTFLRDAKNATRIETKRETGAGTVYLVVNYDTYQGTPVLEDQPNDQADDQEPTKRRPKNKQLKQVKHITTSPASHAAAEKPTAKYPAFDGDLCRRLYDTWIKQRGAVQYGAFRKALAPLFPASGALYSETELTEAISVSSEYVAEMEDRDVRFETIHTFAARIGEWVRLGKQPLAVDGILTERGRNVGTKALRAQRRIG